MGQYLRLLQLRLLVVGSDALTDVGTIVMLAASAIRAGGKTRRMANGRSPPTEHLLVHAPAQPLAASPLP
jgi:hypothetical protein